MEFGCRSDWRRGGVLRASLPTGPQSESCGACYSLLPTPVRGQYGINGSNMYIYTLQKAVSFYFTLPLTNFWTTSLFFSREYEEAKGCKVDQTPNSTRLSIPYCVYRLPRFIHLRMTNTFTNCRGWC
jgi:hypothetical protein